MENKFQFENGFISCVMRSEILGTPEPLLNKSLLHCQNSTQENYPKNKYPAALHHSKISCLTNQLPEEQKGISNKKPT